MEVVQKISEAPVDDKGVPTERIEITQRRRSATRRRRSRCRSRPETSGAARAVPRGARDVGRADHDRVLPDKAPEHVRNFLRLAPAGVYDGTAFHRVVRGFVIQTGALTTRGAADREAADARAHAAAGVQRHEAREGHRLDGARRRSGERHDVVLHRAPATRRRSTASTRRSAGSSTAWPSSRRSSRPPVNGETPVAAIELKGVRIMK